MAATAPAATPTPTSITFATPVGGGAPPPSDSGGNANLLLILGVFSLVVAAALGFIAFRLVRR
jgi:hypothetical protein